MKNNLILSVVILAAGKGTRMKSTKAKVLHQVFFKPMLHHVLDAIRPIKPTRTVVIVGHQENSVRESLNGYDTLVVRQEKQLGTGHAVLMTESSIPEGDGLVMILCGDSPLISSLSLQRMYEQHRDSHAQITVMTTIVKTPTGYGRIISNGNSIKSIVEEKEATTDQQKIQEINTGIYIVTRDLLFDALKNLSPDNSQGEFYLTDIVEFAVSQGLSVYKCINPNPDETLGVNSRVELELAHRGLQKRRNIELMQQGISIYNSDNVSVSPCSAIGRDTVLMPNSQITETSVVGEKCVLENGVCIYNSTIGNNVHIGANSVLRNCTIDNSTTILPLTFLSQSD